MSVALASDLVWAQAQLGTALSAVGKRLQADEFTRPLANPASDVKPGAPLERWLQSGASRLRLSLEPPHRSACGLHELLPDASALLARMPADDENNDESTAYVVVLGPVGRADQHVYMLTPQGVRQVPVGSVERVLFYGDDGGAVDRLGLGETQALAAARAMSAAVGGGLRSEAWLLEPASFGLWQRARGLGLQRLLVQGLIGFVAQVALFAAAWALVGQGALQGRLETGRLLAFGLLLVTMVAVRARAAGALAKSVILFSGLLRERLVEGLLRLPSEEVRTRGVGQMLGTVREVDSLELLARSGGPSVIWVALDLVLGAALLIAGAGGLWHVVLLITWLMLITLWLRTWLRRLQRWTHARLRATHDLVEAMGGHRTMVAQDSQGRHLELLHQGLRDYQDQGQWLDATTARVLAIVPRGWLVLGLVGLLPAFVDRNTSVGALATAVAGVLLVWGALRRLAETSPALSAAYVGWNKLKFLFAAAPHESADSADVLAATPDEAAVGRRGLLVGRDLMFRYNNRPEPVLKHCNFAIERSDRVLLEGDSGGGKSTLGSILSGLRVPNSGVLLLGGFDHHAVGPERWRQRAGGVPQFHENHIFAASLLFNLVLGRRWPPRLEDLQAAEAVCRELGLGPLIDRMPAGLSQTVGDSGWQLSHGERSRVFVARSLLARVDVRVFDESLAALDPETSLRVMGALLARPEALVLIAHR